MTNDPPSGLRNFISSFTDLLKCPVALWIVIGAFALESMAYFGVLNLMESYFSREIHSGAAVLGVLPDAPWLDWLRRHISNDSIATLFVSVFSMLVTLFMLGLGSIAEGFGLRRAILAALLLTFTGRMVYAFIPHLNGLVTMNVVLLAALLIIAVGEAILQPVCYSGVKQYTDEKTSAMGYAMIYALMNMGILFMGLFSSWLRPAVQGLKDGTGDSTAGWFTKWMAGFSGTGIQAVNWVCAGLVLLTFILFYCAFTPRIEARKLRPDELAGQDSRTKPALGARLKAYFAEGPFRNKRFMFFIFMLLPVRTLFAHQWLTMPEYILRAYDKPVADRMEILTNSINAGIILVGVPLVTALTRRVNVYTMMIAGSLVSALPTFLLVGGPNLGFLLAYFVLFSIGEAMWSARFLEYASELAPPGRIAQYMGLANIPWLLAKGTTGIYSGWMLANYCPDRTPHAELHTGSMWLIYSCIAMISPVGLWVARKWVMAGMHTKPILAS